MVAPNDFTIIRLSLASPEQIRGWSRGEVTKPETINYRTLKPEKDGLFCERIFGPTKDFECYCGKYKKAQYKGIICDKCGVEVARSKVRRERMGHIELAAPVAHIWFVKVVPSKLGLLLDLSPRNLEQVIYFAKFIITHVNETGREETIQQLKQDYALKIAEEQDEQRRQQIEEKLNTNLEELTELYTKKLLSVEEHSRLKERWGHLFQAGTGAEAIRELLRNLDLEKMHHKLYQEVISNSGQRGKKAAKRLRIVDAFRKTGGKPEWMILTVLPVLPPELRPMVQLDGGRFATSDLNDLYRRVLNRNNRLKRLIELEAPEVIIRNEKRMLQEAVDSLIDNGRRGRPIVTASGHKLRSFSDLLRGKQGRFRQNLLGKRVDYSGRAVIIAGPELKLNQCGLPKQMAIELFKPFIMRRLMARGLAHNPRSAKRIVEQGKPEVWDILEEVIPEHPILLNRAPTLHRLSIQAFHPVLIDGNAIRVHPLICAAFNADFDGDQMAVHVPLSKAAIAEVEQVMLNAKNMLLPSSGEPVVTPTLDIVLGCYYLTISKDGARGEGKLFSSFDDAKLAYDLGLVEHNAEIVVRDKENGKQIKTTIGRIIFNEVLPQQLGFRNQLIDRKTLKQLTAECYKLLGNEVTASTLDQIKQLGFHYATKSGITMAVNDLEVPQSKAQILQKAEEELAEKDKQLQWGLITEDEHYQSAVSIWIKATEELSTSLEQSLDPYGSIYMMANSGAKGNISQVKQMAGMRGLMSDPSGRIIELPIKANFREGLSVLEYFISTHGARKGSADTALRTSDSGYLTRRLIDVAQQVIIREEDCGTMDGIWLSEPRDKSLLMSFSERIIGRLAASPVIHPQTSKIIVHRNEAIDEDKAEEIIQAGITEIYVRSPLSCRSRQGICARCYGRDLAWRQPISLGTAVGIIAAQSIGEPGTQLTMRTFHTGGIVGKDITSGLPRVEELFEARAPKWQGTISEIDGIVEITEAEEGRIIKVISSGIYRDEYPLSPEYEIIVNTGEWVDANTTLAQPITNESTVATAPILAKVAGKVEKSDNQISILYEETEEREYWAPFSATLLVENGAEVRAGDQLTEGLLNPQEILRIMGRKAVERYLVDEVQKVYRSQGVNIHDKHIEVIVAQMLRRVRIDSVGDTGLIPGELIDSFAYEDINAKVLAEGGEPATAHPVLLGITRASLNTDSFLAAASFQETTRVLTEAAINGATDRLFGLKENVIIGKLIPSQCQTFTAEELTIPQQELDKSGNS
jgi:DNA-directed RNA polymerase subunit beta'